MASHPASSGAERRRQAITEHKRSLILEAAREVFERDGLEKASLRAIAKQAGYTPAALYLYYASKEEMYGELLSHSLDHIHREVAAAIAAESGFAAVRAGALALFGYYNAHPKELEMGFYLTGGIHRGGLTRDLNSTLNRQFRAAVGLLEAPMTALGASKHLAERELASLFSQIVGLLVLHHTGRIKLFHADAGELMSHYVNDMRARLEPRPSKA